MHLIPRVVQVEQHQVLAVVELQIEQEVLEVMEGVLIILLIIVQVVLVVEEVVALVVMETFMEEEQAVLM